MAEFMKDSQQLRYQRNQKNCIAQLPAKILGHIFYLSSLGPHAQAGCLCFDYSKVSQDWRSVAISTPVVWTNIHNVSANWGRVMLERSKMSDLYVFTDNWRASKVEFVQELLKNRGSRLKELDLDLTRVLYEDQLVVLEAVLASFPVSAPRLRYLRLIQGIKHVRGLKFPSDKLTDTRLSVLE